MCPKHRLLALGLSVFLLGLVAEVTTEQARPAQPAAAQPAGAPAEPGLLRSELSLGGRTATMAYAPDLGASDPAHKALLSATAGSDTSRVRVAQLITTGTLRIEAIELGRAGPAGAPPGPAPIRPDLEGARYDLWLETANNGWRIQVTDATKAVVGHIPLSRRSAAPAASNFVAALIPESGAVGRLALRWGGYEATADVQFTNPSRRRVEAGEPNVTTNRTDDEDTSALSRARLLAQRNETALVLPKGQRMSVSFQRTAEGSRRGRGLGVDGPDFARLTNTPDGEVVMLTESSVPRLRIEAPLRFGKTSIATGNQVAGFPGSYGIWLKRAGTGWRLVFNHEPDAWGSQHDPKFDAAEIELSHSGGHAAARPFAVALVPHAPDRGRLVIIWGPHEWTADFVVAS